MKIILLFVAVALIGCSGSKVKSTAETVSAKPAESPTVATSNQKETTTQTSPAKGEGPSQSSLGQATSGSKMVCKAEKDERTVEKFETSTGCELKYTKFGETTVIASSAVGSGHCDRTRDQIKANLEKNGYKCE